MMKTLHSAFQFAQSQSLALAVVLAIIGWRWLKGRVRVQHGAITSSTGDIEWAVTIRIRVPKYEQPPDPPPKQ